jgi:transcriptional regulator with XRE-family HTH domain
MATALLDETTREDLRSKANAVERLVEADRGVEEPSAAAERLRERRARRDAWYREVEDAVLDLTNTLPAGTQDYEARQLFRFLIELKRAIEDDVKAKDADGRVQLASIRMTDVVRRMERRIEHSVLEDPDEAARFVLDQLDVLPAADLARLLGVSTRTVGNWRSGSPVRQKVDRVKLVAQLVAYLRHSMTPTGMLMWFENGADLLDGRAPAELLADDVTRAWAPLVSYARGGRGQLGG